MAEMQTQENVVGADALRRQSHDRATRGDILTEAEQASLTAWYEQQDAEEDALLAASTPQMETMLRLLRNEVEAASAQMLTVTQDIQTLIAENEALHHYGA